MEKEPLTYDQKFDLAIAKFKKMGNRHPSMVWYSEAKFLYSLIPELIEIMELGKQFNIDKFTHQEDIDAHMEYIHLVNKVIGEDDE